MGGRTMVVLLPTWLSRTSSTPPSPSSTFRMFLLTSKFIRKWYHVTVKHQNLDFGKLEQKLSDQQKFRSFAINVIYNNVWHFQSSDQQNYGFLAQLTVFWSLGLEVLLYASWKKLDLNHLGDNYQSKSHLKANKDLQFRYFDFTQALRPDIN